MKRFPVILLLLAFAAGSLGMLGCGDDKDPLYWVDKMYNRPEREQALKRLSEMFSTLRQANNQDVNAAPVREFTEKVVQPLGEAFKAFSRDRINRLEIIKLLATMNNPKANGIFLEGLDVDVTKENDIFIVCAQTLAKYGVTESLPKLLSTHDALVNDRLLRGGTPFSNRENEIDDAVVSALIQIILKNPNVPERAKIVEVLCKVVDTRDTQQDLRINMKSIKALGQIGDAAAIPTLIRGIAMQGEVQKVGLGPFAFVSLQQILDRDAVVDAIIKFGTGKDSAFNDYFAEERKTDPNLKVPVWYLQQSIDFLGNLDYASPKAIEFLMAEVNHQQPDDMDKASAANGEGQQKFTDVQWATWRRNWSIVALAQLGHKPVMDVIKERFVIKPGKGKDAKPEMVITMEEAVGYLQAFGYLELPADTCPILLELAKTRSEAMRDKTYYYASLMCGEDFLPIMKEEHDKIDCDKIVAERIPEDAEDSEKAKAKTDCETLKGRIVTYMDGIKMAKSCGEDFSCYLKAAGERTNPNIETAIYTAYRMARGDEGKSKQLVEVLSKELENPVMAAIQANIFVLDRITPNGDAALVKRAEEVRARFASQQSYKDRARMIEAFAGHVKARTK
jgi:hypothetical protein